MNAPDYPTPWQKKTLWSALTGVAVVTLGGIFVGLVWIVSHVLGFLQPILIPFAVAGVMAYLLDPVVSRIVSWGWSRHRAVFAVFALVTVSLAGVMIWIVPAISEQSLNLAHKVPDYTRKGHAEIMEAVAAIEEKYRATLSTLPTLPTIIPTQKREATPVPETDKATDAEADKSEVRDTSPDDAENEEMAPATEDSVKTTPADAATTGTANPASAKAIAGETEQGPSLKQLLNGDWLQSAVIAATKNSWNLIRDSLGGFLGVVGFLVSLIIVPIYLYYFLIEASNIAANWSDYLPLRASTFKDEVVSVLNEINGYLIAFFRGQLVVSLVNGSITSLGLVIAGLDFGLLLGIVLCFIGIIPYLGITMCWVVSVVIASVQGGSWCVPGHPWWVFPLVVSGIFIVVHNIDGLFVTPKIVGESVGLHPLTVIVSVFVWSLLMGGLLGAILAVPMTATIKVLLKRYVWERQFRAPEIAALHIAPSLVPTPGEPIPAVPEPAPAPAASAPAPAPEPKPEPPRAEALPAATPEPVPAK